MLTCQLRLLKPHKSDLIGMIISLNFDFYDLWCLRRACIWNRKNYFNGFEFKNSRLCWVIKNSFNQSTWESKVLEWNPTSESQNFKYFHRLFLGHLSFTCFSSSCDDFELKLNLKNVGIFWWENNEIIFRIRTLWNSRLINATFDHNPLCGAKMWNMRENKKRFEIV